MGVFSATSQTLRDGTLLTLRYVVPDDVAAYYAFLRAAAATTDNILTAPDEFPTDEDENRRMLERDLAAPDGVRIVALHGQEMVGTTGLHTANRRRSAHVVRLGMLVSQPWRGRGVGRCLLAHARGWARAHPTVERVVLEVYSTNDAGLALYRSMGFELEGRRLAARRENGVYADEILMGLWVKPPPPGYEATSPTP